jgi:choline dehydrogenase-like flavoprotein
MSTYDDSIGDVDIIFAGGGTAACVAAGRLAKGNPDLKILLVEGGRTNFQDPTVTNPAVYLSHLAPDSKTALVNVPPISSYSIFYSSLDDNNWKHSSTNPNKANISTTEKPSFLWVESSVVAHPLIS